MAIDEAVEIILEATIENINSASNPAVSETIQSTAVNYVYVRATGSAPGTTSELFKVIEDTTTKSRLETMLNAASGDSLKTLIETTLLSFTTSNKAFLTAGNELTTIVSDTVAMRSIVITSDGGKPTATLVENSDFSNEKFKKNEIVFQCNDFSALTCSGNLLLSTVLKESFTEPHLGPTQDSTDDEKEANACGYKSEDGVSDDTVDPCSISMDTNVECVELIGEFTKVGILDITESSGCTISFKADVGDCHSNRDQFLRLAWYDPTTQCFKLDGISSNNGNNGDPEATTMTSATTVTTRAYHLTTYSYTNKIPASFSEARFRIIWTFVIAFNVIFDILLFVSLVMCIIYFKKDFPDKQDTMDINDDDDGEQIEIENLQIEKQSSKKKGQDDGEDSDESALTRKEKKQSSHNDQTTTATLSSKKKGNRQAIIVTYLLMFLYKNPLVNPIIARHPHVDRFSRGLIHYTLFFIWFNIEPAFLHPDGLNSFWLTHFFISYPIIWIFSRIWTEVLYLLMQRRWFILEIILCVIVAIISIGTQVSMYFIIEALEWQRFKQLWWAAPDIMVLEFIIWELFINIFNVLFSRKLVTDRNAFGGEESGGRKFLSRWTNQIIYAYLDSY